MTRVTSLQLLCSALVILLATTVALAQSFQIGGDYSIVPRVQMNGAQFYANGQLRDPVTLLQERGVTLIRIRLWHTPTEPWHGIDSAVAFAARCSAQGLAILLDIHYSDTWADPGQQTPPAAWQGLSDTALRDSMYQYTYNVLSRFRTANATPQAVQIGNEITNGMLWNSGRVDGSWNTPEQWNRFASFLQSAIRGMHDAIPAGEIVPEIYLHTDLSGDSTRAIAFYRNLQTRIGSDFTIALSYYPWWHGSLAQFRTTVTTLANTFQRPIFIAETAYPWTLSWNDTTFNLVGTSSQLLPGIPATPDGQAAFLDSVGSIVAALPNGLGRGICYWEPAWVSTASFGSPWENLALFDFHGNILLPVANVLQRLAQTSVPESANRIPATFAVSAFPNPFNATISAKISVPLGEPVQCYVYDSGGRIVYSTLTNFPTTNDISWQWNASHFAAGTYYLRVKSGSQNRTIPIIFLK
ncbi:MAG: glycosyl hydrolase 53 family protein [bacterium]|nr:glycosyl hydrolase 53 family protein [bacterium]